MQEQLFVAPTSGTTPNKKSSITTAASVSAQPEWELDETTKAIGRRGLATAREALRKARAQADEDLPVAA